MHHEYSKVINSKKKKKKIESLFQALKIDVSQRSEDIKNDIKEEDSELESLNSVYIVDRQSS